MPTTIGDLTGRIEDQVMEALRASQDTVVETVRNLAGTVERVLPEQARDGLATGLPMAADAADAAFGFAGRVLEAQHEFVNRVLAAAGLESPATPKAKPASKTAAA